MTAPTVWAEEHFVAGEIALDFANTVTRRAPDIGADLLGRDEDLLGWLQKADLLPPDSPGPAMALDLARDLRSLEWVVFDAQRNGGSIPTEALAGLLDIARAGAPGIRLGADGAIRPLTGEGVLAFLALRATALALTPPARGVRACAGCGWYFLDTSRGSRRRWCSMQTCGNRHKGARYRAGRRP